MTDTGASTTLPKQGPARAGRGEAATLCIVYSPDAAAVGQQIPLTRAATPLALGREPGSGVRISDPHLSRVHFNITWDAESQVHRLSDRESSNGSFVNGQRVDTCPLAANDVLRSGDTLLVYVRSSPMSALMDQLPAVAGANLTVLLQGETGTGKEVLARRLHERGRRTGNFVVLSAGTLTDDSAALELFGSVDSPGAFANAANGTLLLDEISDLPLHAQPKLLRVLDTGLLKPVGGVDEVSVDVQVIASTCRDLNAAVRLGTFRDDLLARLSGITLVLPPLRERRAEILTLAAELAAPEPFELSADAAEAVLAWHYPHNVRELKALVAALTAARGSATSVGVDMIDVDLIEKVQPKLVRRGSFVEHAVRATAPPPELREKLVTLLMEHKGNVSSVSKALSVSRARLYRWLESFGLSADGFRAAAEIPGLRELEVRAPSTKRSSGSSRSH